jgi:hypothetical protein
MANARWQEAAGRPTVEIPAAESQPAKFVLRKSEAVAIEDQRRVAIEDERIASEDHPVGAEGIVVYLILPG